MPAFQPAIKLNRTRTRSASRVTDVENREFDALFLVPESCQTPVLVRFNGHLMGKERPRRNNGGSNFYTPKRSSAVEALVALAGRQAMVGRSPLTGALFARVCIFRKVPASWGRRKREMALAGRLLPQTKPDIDNQIKALFDALEKVVYINDAQIVSKWVVRRFAEEDGVIAEFRTIGSGIESNLELVERARVTDSIGP